ncbi:MAG: hypothetical protein GY798_26520 [Hyphomicrobiales bacterium]|nr:hypothetical protein [Hyphomicrobiales bacterium]
MRPSPGLLPLLQDSHVGQWTSSILGQHIHDPGGPHLWDALATVVAIDRSSCGYAMVPIRVIADRAATGWSFGDTAKRFPDSNWRREQRSALDPTTAGTLAIDYDIGRWITLCRQPNAIAFKARFLESLGNYPQPALP